MDTGFDNPFEATATIGGEHAELTVRPKDGWVMEVGGTVVRELTVRAHRAKVPRVGQRVMACGGHVLVEVADVRLDGGGNVMLLDADTKAWVPL